MDSVFSRLPFISHSAAMLEKRSMHFRCFRAAVLVAISVLSCFALSSAQADVIYTTFGPGNTFDTAGYEVFGASSNSLPGSASPPRRLPGCLLSHNRSPSMPPRRRLVFPSPLTPALSWNSSATTAATPARSSRISDHSPLNPTATIKTYSSVAHPLLTAGTYWLVAVPVGPGTTGSWRRSAIDFAHPTSPANYFGNADLTAPSTTWTVFNDPIGNPGSSYAPAFEIDGTLVPVPAPKTVWAGAVLLVGWVVGRKLRGRGTA